ncbi:MAG: hypothetical protein DRJ03_18160 [Chloroflexi bacterium]|nr:MAG: hypothetical protein B6I35_13215 [Anaerolineaceae bacterium 4572_32.2]RLC83006.1 MAG: hypothetical protein DRJ03_18160 [Chloroflexota bacterium]HEY73768.1 hypothetical protein [Thermoflexia bacterium]
MFKLLMSWNIRSGQEEAYFEFIVRKFGPGLVQLGIRPTDAWYTQYGDRPQILTGGITEDMESLQTALASDEWLNLREKLFTYVTDYSQKVVRASGGFQV